jgi:hypothetical protein
LETTSVLPNTRVVEETTHLGDGTMKIYLIAAGFVSAILFLGATFAAPDLSGLDAETRIQAQIDAATR